MPDGGGGGDGGGDGAWRTQRVLVPVLDGLIMLTGVVGHSLAVLTLAGRGRGRGRCQGGRREGGGGGGGARSPAHATDTLLLALSAADLLQLACLPFHTAAIALGRWPFGRFLCKAVSFLGVACSSASVFTLAALAVARYLTLAHPAWAYRLRACRAGRRWRLRLAAAALWVPAAGLAAPQFAVRTVGPPSAAPLACFAFLSDVGQLVYGAGLFLLGFALPLLVIVLTYARIYRFLRRAGAPGRAPQLERYQRRVTRTSALLVLVFTLCWLPSYALMFGLAAGRAPASAPAPAYRAFAVFARLLASSAAVANPVLYVFVSRKFRRDLAALGRGCCRRRRDTVRPLEPAEAGDVPQS
ncbi:delta-type opioid receptor-like [Anguilla rostrata]|uniref:delta-type opioid receptor-like n=1 Tax=Anguilla rostrata TaxID=7938 RepID=UPI0030CE7D82